MAAQAQVAPESSFVLTNPAGGRLIEVTGDASGNVTIAWANEVLHGRLKEQKRKYDSLEVKFGEEGGFKVRTLDGKLLWKVKVTPEKIKVSDNEENRDPFELKVKDGKIKVYAPGERLLGQVRSKTDHVEVEDAAGVEKYRGAGTKAEAFYGAALLVSIPARERAVIFAELAIGR